MRIATKEFTVYNLKSRSGTENEMLFVKTETKPAPIGQLNCNRQLIIST